MALEEKMYPQNQIRVIHIPDTDDLDTNIRINTAVHQACWEFNDKYPGCPLGDAIQGKGNTYRCPTPEIAQALAEILEARGIKHSLHPAKDYESIAFQGVSEDQKQFYKSAFGLD